MSSTSTSAGSGAPSTTWGASTSRLLGATSTRSAPATASTSTSSPATSGCAGRTRSTTCATGTATTTARAARQQDFLRQAKAQIGAKQIFEKRDRLLERFGRDTQTEKSLQGAKALLDLGQLAFLSAGDPVREVKFPPSCPTARRPPTSATARNGCPSLSTSSCSGRTASSGKRRSRSRTAKVRLEAAARQGEDQAIVAARGTPFLIYYPTQVAPGGAYQGPGPPLPPAHAGRHQAACLHDGGAGARCGPVLRHRGHEPAQPSLILQKPDARRKIGARTYSLDFDGSKLRLVVFRRQRGHRATSTLTLLAVQQADARHRCVDAAAGPRLATLPRHS